MPEPTCNDDYPRVDLPPDADTPGAAVRFLIGELVRTGRLPLTAVAEVERGVWQRERLGSTGVGHGIAIPHTQTTALAEPVGVIGRSARPIRWSGALDGEPVGVVCLVVAQTGPALHVFRGLERLARRLRDDDEGPPPRPV